MNYKMLLICSILWSVTTIHAAGDPKKLSPQTSRSVSRSASLNDLTASTSPITPTRIALQSRLAQLALAPSRESSPLHFSPITSPLSSPRSSTTSSVTNPPLVPELSTTSSSSTAPAPRISLRRPAKTVPFETTVKRSLSYDVIEFPGWVAPVPLSSTTSSSSGTLPSSGGHPADFFRPQTSPQKPS